MTRLKEIANRAEAARTDLSFTLRVYTWLTAGDGRQFCAHAIEDVPYLLAFIESQAKEIEALRNDVRTTLCVDRSRGYPTGSEWMQIVNILKQGQQKADAIAKEREALK